jgi:hypothetical protein
MEVQIMTTLPEVGKTAFGNSDAKKEASATDPAPDQVLAIEPAHIQYRNHETLTARGWLAHRSSWPKDQHTKYGVAIPFGEIRILVAVARNRDRSRS